MADIILAQWNIIQKIILNTIFVSIPEELFLTMFTLILMGEFDYWCEEECKKLINPWDYSRVLIPTIVTALIVNIFRYYNINNLISNIIPFIVYFSLLAITNEILHEPKAFKWMLKAVLCFLLGFIILCISEMMYLPFVLYNIGLSIKEVNNNILMNFFVSIPIRIIQYSILLFTIVKKRTTLKGNILKQITSSPLITTITFTSIILNLSFLLIINNAIINHQLLHKTPLLTKIVVVVGIVLTPIINISSLIWGIYLSVNRIVKKQKDVSSSLYNLVDNIKTYINNNEYTNVTWKLNEVSNTIEDITQELYEIK